MLSVTDPLGPSQLDGAPLVEGLLVAAETAQGLVLVTPNRGAPVARGALSLR